ncbi:hypothetical protein CN384_32155 [Bacillus thuringiensis]|uniref:hypothetical protein n=1 Tax=Bacillus thuringiensis TaxID=1428 RepID=UPI000BF808AD|nr:hypothetical protein [Bacillus thuringiensis]PFA19986.1 hypothetical protein CN384_32155 [Bacillus thuringiensis]
MSEVVSDGLRIFEEKVLNEFYNDFKIKLDKDVIEFMQATNDEDELQIILRGQLYIEHEIEKLLRFSLVEPEIYFRNNPMFNSKLNLVVALGILPRNKMSTYEKFNRLRNKFAHELKYKVTKEKMDELVSTMDAELKADVFEQEWNEKSEMSDEKRQLLKLKRFMLSLWIYLSRLLFELSVDAFHDSVVELDPDNKLTLEEYHVECLRMFEVWRDNIGVPRNLS